MNKLFKRALRLLLVAAMIIPSVSVHSVYAKDNTAHDITQLSDQQLQALTNPILQSYKSDGSHQLWQLTSDTRLVVLATKENIANKRLQEVVKLVNSEFVGKKIVTSPLVMVYALEKDVTSKDIVIDLSRNESITSQSHSEEAYKLIISDKGVRLTAASENAVMYGLRTILNLMISGGGLVYGEIVDYPHVAERRLHVDCGRKYISKDWFIRQIREMSYMKMNAIQMHFSENLGFRIECETDPSIVSDQYLTKKEVKEILAEARKYGVKVIPSFDSPGHVDQILRAHPEYGQVNNRGEHYKSGLDITNPKAIEYIYSLYDEYMELFEGCTDFHIGGDEYMEFDRPPFTTEYQSVLNEYALKKYGAGYTWKDVVSGYINDLAEHVHNRGFKPRIWNDGIYYGESNTKQKIKMHDYIGIDFWSQMGWNWNIAKLQTFIDKGHDTLYNVNCTFFYYVLRNQKPTDGREQHSFDHLNADRRIYDEWTPGKFESNIIDDHSSLIKGASMAIWCDKPDLVDEDVITDDIANEMRALASKAWNTNSNTLCEFDKFKKNHQVLGHAAGYEKGSQLVDAGDFIESGDLGKVTLHYVDDKGHTLKDDVVKYGVIGEVYSFKADDIYGYRVLDEKAKNGIFTKDGHEYTFVYQLYTDKTLLNQEVINVLDEQQYIDETIDEYKKALEHALKINDKVDANQKEVDQAYQKLIDTKKKAVKIEYYPLYVESTYMLKQNQYIAGYDAYKKAVDEGNALLYSKDINSDKAQEAYLKIIKTKENLVKPDGHKPRVEASKTSYSDYQNSYPYDNMLDHNVDTKCWFNGNQKDGDVVTFIFPQPMNMTSVQVIQPKDVGNDALENAVIEISLDGNDWHEVGNINSTQLDYTATFDKTRVQYVRIRLKADKSNWYQISEVLFTYEQEKVDHTLRDLIVSAEGLDIQGKSPKVVKNMINSLIDAQKAYVNNTVDTSTVEKNLKQAIELVKNAAHITKLFDLVTEVKDLNEDLYTPSSWSLFKQAYDKAITVLNNMKATQTEVDVAYDNLNKAYQSLKEVVEVDKTQLNNLMNTVKGLKEKDYTVETWKVLKEALNKAHAVIEDNTVTQTEVDVAYDNLNKAYQSLKEVVEFDKTQLNNLMNTVKGLKEKDYTVETWKVLKEALNQAHAVIEDNTVTQDKVDAAYKALVLAYNHLKRQDSYITVHPNHTTKPQEQSSDKVETSDYTSFTAVGTLFMATLGLVLLRKKKEN